MNCIGHITIKLTYMSPVFYEVLVLVYLLNQNFNINFASMTGMTLTRCTKGTYTIKKFIKKI